MPEPVQSKRPQGLVPGLLRGLRRQPCAQRVEQCAPQGDLPGVPTPELCDEAAVDGVDAVEGTCDLAADGTRGVRIPQEVDASRDRGHERPRVVHAVQSNRQAVHAVGAEVILEHGVAVVLLAPRCNGLQQEGTLRVAPVPAALFAALDLRTSQQLQQRGLRLDLLERHVLRGDLVQELRSGLPPPRLARDRAGDEVAEEGAGVRGAGPRVRRVRRLSADPHGQVQVPVEEDRHRGQTHDRAVAGVVAEALEAGGDVPLLGHDEQRQRDVASQANRIASVGI
mmetsp:Transcript_130723/g.419232  ORF Transcript_130723/g.419232 Transcript_130723/m.419232 type:complete len:282 (+) Transcript_130723:215-1060(+)